MLLLWYVERSGCFTEASKRTKIVKIKEYATDFGEWVWFVGVLWWGCAQFEELRLIIFDLGSVLRRDVSKIGGFGVTFGNNAFYVIGRWYFFVRVAFQDHTFYHQGRGCTYQDQPQGELSKINKIKLLTITFLIFLLPI